MARSPAVTEAVRDQPRVEFGRRTCIRLLFDVSPSPDQKLVLTLDGVAVEGKTLELPRIHFDKAAGWLISMAP